MKGTWTFDHGRGPFTITGHEKGGLIVHKGTSAAPYQSWRVSHLGSGFAATAWLDKRRDAVAARDRFLAAGDWTRGREELQADTALWEAARVIAQSLR